ncbi:hypothetical protein RHSIM_Rhsim11G0017200 [Rhododendron simsii]|uniref:Uncharacterized protein n=1 Tax=Rhododendron simsii TaxID=118357 RepID=A0A834LAX3_RHOSS|nr:hypothetical protein RHSIM_Rhsim11G0017200 [Rhododendron simsii]
MEEGGSAVSSDRYRLSTRRHESGQGRIALVPVHNLKVFSMVDSPSSDSPRIDPDAYQVLQDTIRALARGYWMGNMSFDESSSNFAQPAGLPVIPGIHVPLQVDDRASRDILYGQGDSLNAAAELVSHGFEQEKEGHAERAAAGAHASTFTSAGALSNAPNVGRAGGSPRDINVIPSLPIGLGPMPYNHLYNDGLGGFTDGFQVKYEISDDVLVGRVTGEKITFGEDFIILPLYTITEGGVSENFEWGPINPLLDFSFPTRTGPAIERPYKIPRVRGFPGYRDAPDCFAPNKRLFITGMWPNLIALLRCTDQEAPTLLSYEPTYSGFAHRKDKSKMVRKTVDPATIAGEALSVPIYYPGSLHLPSTDPSGAARPPKTTFTEDSNPAGEGEDRRAEKRAKVAEDDIEIIGASHATADASKPNESPALFKSDFECLDGYMITAADSLAENPLLAVTLLKGVAPPKDMENLLDGKANNMVEVCHFLVKGELRIKREEAKTDTKEIKKLEGRVAEAVIVLEERDRLLTELLEEASDAGYNEAEEHYKQQVEGLVKKAFKDGELRGIEETHNSSFLLGYKAGLDYAEVHQVDH